jgi:hypothetical protein
MLGKVNLQHQNVRNAKVQFNNGKLILRNKDHRQKIINDCKL